MVYTPAIDISPAPKTREIVNRWTNANIKHRRMVGRNSFCFMNETRSINSEKDWKSTGSSLLWKYNLHYFDDLCSIKAYERVEWHRKIIQKWIDNNTLGEDIGWEPYPTSIRIVNWIKWILEGNEAKQEWIHSIAIQARFLERRIEYHLLGNHIFTNAKALIFAGLFFCGKEAEHWLRKGEKIIGKALSEQVLDDGGQYELSTMYHALFVEDLLDINNIYKTYGYNDIDSVNMIIPVSLRWLQVMLHPDGQISFFNDAAHNVAPAPDKLFSYAERLGINIRELSEGVYNLQNSGYVIIKKSEMKAFIDIGRIGPDHLPAHAHADTLTFELSIFNRRIVVNSGTSVYGSSKERFRQRGTAAHNTVVIDNLDSSEVWGGFRVAKRAQPTNIDIQDTDNIVRVMACHNGYNRIKGKPVHCREWNYSSKKLLIKDKIINKGTHSAVFNLHLHPSVKIVSKKSKNMLIASVDNHSINIELIGDGKMELASGTYHPEFGKDIQSIIIHYYFTGKNDSEVLCQIKW